jgi:three-Cys-motif partner protein
MASFDDKKHFDDYREQTQVKHDILAAYLRPYFHILKSHSNNLIYIDAFAGRGTYTRAETEETVDGSPLRALKLIAESEDFSKQVSTVFIEADEDLFRSLKSTVEAFYREHPYIRAPRCLNGTFADQVNQILKLVKGALAPTFLFVDPCGVRGTSLDTIRAVMDCDKCEVFIFFNVDGIRRTAGLPALSPVLIELMGSKERAQALYEALRATTNTRKRETIITDHYRRALVEEIGAEYVVTFRIEHEDQRKTSHCLIHATKHPLGFSIMKDVMWRRGRSEDRQGALELAQRSRTNFIPLFDLSGDEVKESILAALKDGPLQVGTFYKKWTQRPDDLQCEGSYRQFLLELEAERKIEVLSDDLKRLMPASNRPRQKGNPTLAKHYYVRLRN